MSNYFDIYCRTCSTRGNVFHVNHGGAKIARICRDLAVIAEIGSAMARLTCDLELGHPNPGYDNIDVITPDLLGFAMAHAGHDVAARSEYGGFHDRCSLYWRCGCNALHACDMDPGHPGPCGPRTGKEIGVDASVP